MTSRTVQNPVVGDQTTFVETSTETQGRYSLVEIRVNPGGGPPEHYHDAFDEEIVAVEGPLWVSVDGHSRILQPGERVNVPRGVRHAWRNASEAEVTFQARFTPGHQGFETFLRVNAGLGQDGLLNDKGIPRDLRTLALMIRWGDSNLPGPMRLMNPVFRWLAARAEASGLGDRLRQRYQCE
jgi:quercetin dioxygenase-like cupin family protein